MAEAKFTSKIIQPRVEEIREVRIDLSLTQAEADDLWYVLDREVNEMTVPLHKVWAALWPLVSHNPDNDDSLPLTKVHGD